MTAEPSSTRRSLENRPRLELGRARNAIRRAGEHIQRIGGPAPRWARWVRIVGVAVAGVFLAYLLAANVILRTGLLRGWLNKDEQELRVQYSAAWSMYPGHVAVRGFSLRYQDANVEMEIGIDKARLVLSLWALTHRTFHVDRVDAEGVTFRILHKVESLEGNEGRVSAFPHIEGFQFPPVEKHVPKPAIAEEDYKLWTIDVAGITATAREVWTMEYRYRGDATVTGAFHLRPRRELWIAPSVMVTHGGVLSLGDRDLIRGGEGRVEASFEPFDVRVQKGIEVLRHLSGSVRQTGELATLASVSETYFPGTSVALERGSGPIDIDVHVEHGVFQPASRVTYRSGDAVVNAGPVRVESDVSLVAHVDGPPEHPLLALELETASAGVAPRARVASTKARALDIQGAKATIALDNADLVAESHVTRASVVLPSARIADLRAWQPLAPEHSSFDGGAASFVARAEYQNGALDGRVDVALDRTRMTFPGLEVGASGKAWSNLESADPSKALAFPGAGADLTGIALRLRGGSAHAEGLWLRTRFKDTKVMTAGEADADIAVEAGPGDRTLELMTRLAHLPDVAADAAAGTHLSSLLHLRVRPSDVSLAVTQAKNGALEARGRVRRKTDTTTGAFLLSVGPFTTGVDIQGGEVSVRPLAGGAWLDERLRQR